MEKVTFENNTESKKTKMLTGVRRSLTWLAIGAATLVGGCREGGNTSQEDKLLQSELKNAFPKNEAKMNPHEKEEFKKTIIHFLEAHNTLEQAAELEQARITLEVSSDERETTTWKGGNEELSEARAQEIKTVYYELIDSLYQTQTFQALTNFFAKKINTKIAISPDHGRGVTSLSQLKNPLTNKPYTKDEIEQLPPAEVEALYETCRYVKILIELPAENEHTEQFTKLVQVLSDFPHTRILLDNSSSMDEENTIFAEKIAEALTANHSRFSSHDNRMVTFSNRIDWDNYTKVKDAKDVEAFMNETGTGDDDEHQLSATHEMLAKMEQEYESGKYSDKKREAGAIIMLSDEGISDFSVKSLTDLIEKAEKTNTTVFFALINNYSPDRLITMIDAKSLLMEAASFRKNENSVEFSMVYLDVNGNIIFN
ncbi:MAG: VWA domain-containing protein [Candidatus Pacebacteria bacterium]|jgi:hypothetical protein|nr:VWA domain-containing protein [Candidatus Paceibacterota bacterium]